jgi:hypothetical protein
MQLAYRLLELAKIDRFAHIAINAESVALDDVPLVVG